MEVELKMGSILLQREEAMKKEMTINNYEDYTELSLGLGLALPGGGGEGGATMVRKRGFSETEATVDLKLNLSNTSKLDHQSDEADKKQMEATKKETKSFLHGDSAAADSVKPPSKAQVVGWPPVRSFRKNMMAVQKGSKDEESATGAAAGGGSGAFVKVSMDGAPYLRKVDLKMYSSYRQLSGALASMFSSFTIGSCESQGVMNERKVMDLLNVSDYVPTYEDKDGDWMLVGDVPWEMFVDSCKRLRIMKGTEAIGLAPRAMEKCKNRS